jgi:hypothetical protein
MAVICMQYDTDQYGRSTEEAAYELYVQRGRVDRDDLSDWFLAEKMSRKTTSPASGEVAVRRTAASKSNRKKAK